MKPRTSPQSAKHGPEFKGVVKKIAGKLTDRPDLVKEGRAELFRSKAKRGLNPDPHRRG